MHKGWFYERRLLYSMYSILYKCTLLYEHVHVQMLNLECTFSCTSVHYCMYMPMFICPYTTVLFRMFIFMYKCTLLYVHAYVHMCMYKCTLLYVHAYVHMCMYKCTILYVHVQLYFLECSSSCTTVSFCMYMFMSSYDFQSFSSSVFLSL